MKVNQLILRNLFLITTIGTMACFSCRRSVQDSGKIKVDLTDAPGEFIQVNIDVQEVVVHYSAPTLGKDGWISLATDTGIYDLLLLRSNVTAAIAPGNSMPIGNVNQLRLILGPNNSVMTMDSLVHPLLLSSQDNTGLKINLNSGIVANKTVVIVLDFDAEASVISQGNGNFRLKPVIKIDTITYL